MADVLLSDIAHLVLLFAAALILLLVRALRRRTKPPPLFPTAPDLPALAVDELIGALAELRPDLSSRQVREKVKVLLLRYESERRVEDDDDRHA
jgi:hypothetical protein